MEPSQTSSSPVQPVSTEPSSQQSVPSLQPQGRRSSKMVIVLLAVGLLLLAVGAAAGYFYSQQTNNPNTNPVGNGTPLPQPEEGPLCTMEALECPDGSFVGRTGPNCEFAACPGN